MKLDNRFLFRGHEEYQPKDYQLECLVEDQFYFIMSPRYSPRKTRNLYQFALVKHEQFIAGEA